MECFVIPILILGLQDTCRVVVVENTAVKQFAGAMAEQGRSLEEILSTAKEVTSRKCFLDKTKNL